MTTLVLIGPHGAGKTTIGRALAARLGWEFDGEIGRLLRERALARDPGAHALCSGPAFDREVFRRELARDERRRGGPRVVESWHPINLAYAATRNPEVARRWRGRLTEAMRGSGPVVVVPLRLDRAAALSRLSEPGPSPGELVDFFASVAREAERLTRAAGLERVAAIETARCSPRQAVERVVERLQGVGSLPEPSSVAR